ncbi:unnamed protein product [Rhodiola kirilowii]
MWLSTSTMESLLVSRPSTPSKCMIAGLGLMILVVSVGYFSLGYIFFTSMFLILSTACFTLFYTQNPKECKPNYEKEEEDEACSEHAADKGVFKTHGQIQGSESIHRAPNYLTSISENESTAEYDEDHCITTSEDMRGNHVGRSSLSSEDDGSISDEDTLIEIELPTGHYLSPKELEKHMLNTKRKLPDYHYSRTRQEKRWMELLSEANNDLATEEDNLIEIDISIGSIMCPRSLIQA